MRAGSTRRPNAELIVLIRRFRLSDLRSIVRIEAQSFGAGRWTEEVLLWYARNYPALFLVAVDCGRIAGYSVAVDTVTGARLDSIAVRPFSRRRGIGSELLRGTLERLKRRRVRAVTLMVRRDNAEAIRLYRRFGFRRTATVPRYYEDEGAAWRMRLVLRSADKH